MPVSFDQFSDIAARQNVRDSGAVTVDSRQDLRLNQSRFRLVRWVRNTGVGKRVQNRNTVDAFISSLQHHYGPDVTSRMDFRPLRDLQSRGKPLRVRDIKAAIGEARMVADGIKSVKSSNVEALVDEKIAGSAYFDLAGGEDLVNEVRSKVDVAGTQQQIGQTRLAMAARGTLSGAGSLSTAQTWVSSALNDAHEDIFLTGYGVKTGQGQQFDRLQRIVDRHPRAQALYKQYGLRFDASRASGALYGTLTEKLSNTLSEVLEHPEQLPGDGTVKERVEQAISRKADQVVGEFIRERADALGRLREMHARGEIRPEDMATFKADGHRSLADVVLHHRIPPDMLSRLYALRSETPDNLGELASADHTMEDKIQVMRQFGEALSGIYDGISGADFDKYLYGEDSKLNYTEDCGRFLLEGKLSANDESAIRHAVRTDSPGSDLPDLLQGIAGMRGALYHPDANQGHWAAAKEPLDNMSMAAMALLGADAPPPLGEYATDAGNALTALRNCGIDAPPPDNYGEIQSGKGAFSRTAVELAQSEMEFDLKDTRKTKSKEYPEFHAEAIRDFNRADFIIGGSPVERGDTAGVVEGIRKFCTNADGNPDDRMIDIVGQMVYQRSNSMGFHRFSTGMNVNNADTATLVTTAPVVGMPVVNYTSVYTVAKNDNGNVWLQLSSAGPATHLNHPLGAHTLDEDKSRVAFNINVEIDAQDYSARVTGIDYEFLLVPAHEAARDGQ